MTVEPRRLHAYIYDCIAQHFVLTIKHRGQQMRKLRSSLRLVVAVLLLVTVEPKTLQFKTLPSLQLCTEAQQCATASNAHHRSTPTFATTLPGLRGMMPLSDQMCSSIPEDRLCMSGVRWAPSWWMASSQDHPFICEIFEHFYCALRGCRQWNYFQLHYVLDSLIKHNPVYRRTVDALLDLSANEFQPGPHLFHVDYDAPAYMYKRPSMNETRYMEYVDDVAFQAKKSGRHNKLEALPFPRTIYYMWLQGEEHLRTVHNYNHVAFKAWKKLNPHWNFAFLTFDNIAELAPLSHALWTGDRNANGRQFSHLSDLTRVELLCRNGGVWADASLMPMVPLDDFIAKELAKPGRDFLMYRFTNPHP